MSAPMTGATQKSQSRSRAHAPASMRGASNQPGFPLAMR